MKENSRLLQLQLRLAGSFYICSNFFHLVLKNEIDEGGGGCGAGLVQFI